MKVKDGVRLSDLQLPMRVVLIEADKLWKSEGFELVVTSTGDGVHSPGSLHPYGYAVDFRTWANDQGAQWGMDFKQRMAQKLNQRIGSDYQVLPKRTHIHVEYEKALELEQ